MGQEYFINSQALEDKIRQSLPSQGGAGAGFDLSASTQIIPIIDVTETAEGSTLRADLQSAFSHDDITTFLIAGTTTTLITNTGYFRVFGSFNTHIKSAGGDARFSLSDGATTKNLITYNYTNSGVASQMFYDYDFIVFLSAGDSFIGSTDNVDGILQGSTKQIADITGTLTNPT